MKDILKIAGAFIGFIVGAGFASGQELLQFFVSFGMLGILGVVLSTVLFIVMGMILASYGSQLKATSHQQVVDEIFGDWLSKPVDLVMTFFMFAIVVVMIAGAGSLLNQQLGLPQTLGSALATVFVVFVTWMKTEKVLSFISSITPMLIIMTLIIGFYSISHKNLDFVALGAIAETGEKATSNWILSAFLYVSYNIFACVAILAISGGKIKSKRKAALGGLIGGLVLGGLMLLAFLAMISQIDLISGSSMPMISIAQQISPTISYVFSFIIFLMILNTAVGALYSFSSRFSKPGNSKFRILSSISGVLAYLGSMYGFINLVGVVYPFLGYIGFILMIAIAFALFKKRRSVDSTVEVLE